LKTSNLLCRRHYGKDGMWLRQPPEENSAARQNKRDIRVRGARLGDSW
jgi:hypothetical protein